jgi:hypothetical protein
VNVVVAALGAAAFLPPFEDLIPLSGDCDCAPSIAALIARAVHTPRKVRLIMKFSLCLITTAR